ncbi:hypothetical protein ABEB36_004055 [Hypothenemus hampei]|uniref:Protein SPT2 homolog n=1 Tax=Hypothenemus hampei TaxID=57062 RepID=A0ABD1F564_HYPHA
MDFCQLLNKAKKNDQNANGVRYYSTKFEPPKKLKRENKELSENIKKFLAKQQADEQRKLEEEKRKKQELLTLRSQDKKATRRVNVMLKRTKSANQSVIEDAIDKTHTAVTRAGPEQPDEDDYGYVSQEASAFYEKMMAKYSQLPEEPKFNLLKKKVNTNLNNTKDRVKAALEKEKEDATHPRKRKRKHEDGDNNNRYDIDLKDEKGSEESISKSKPKPSGPPPMSFMELLKVAEQKQFEPILIEEKPQEEERLYTKKQKKEIDREREWREKREQRQKDDKDKTRIPKIPNNNTGPKPMNKSIPNSENKEKLLNPVLKNNDALKKTGAALDKTTKSVSNASSRNISLSTKPNFNSKNNVIRKDMLPKKSVVSQSVNGKLSEKSKEVSPRDLISKSKPKEFPPKYVKPKEFPPLDVRGVGRKKPMIAHRGRIMDDDDEYDSELDDFIDDGPEEQDYSGYIKEIFGYDKSRYRDMDDDVDNMESSFAQQMKEEVISTKIGIMEDLEDMKKEEEEKKQKILKKKKMKR